MLRTIGYAFAVLTVGTVAIAWTNGAGPNSGSQASTFSPEQFHAISGSLPRQEFTDLTFVYAND
jgi:hypothetical protein